MRTTVRSALRGCMLRRRRLMRRRSRVLLRSTSLRSAGRPISVVRWWPRHIVRRCRSRRTLRTVVRVHRCALRTVVHRRRIVGGIAVGKATVTRGRPRHVVRRRVRLSIAVRNLIVGHSASRRRTIVVRVVRSRHRRLGSVGTRRCRRRSRVGHHVAIGRRSRWNSMGNRRVSAKNGLLGRRHGGPTHKLSLAQC